MSRTIEYRPLDEVQLNEANPKAHRVDLLESSVGRFGFVEPIIEDGRTGRLIAGHGRTTALRQLMEEGQAPPDGVRLDDDGRWLVPVVTGWSSRTDHEESAALIALNRTSEVGGWVDDSLLTLLDQLTEVEGGLDGVGYREDEVDALRTLLAGLSEEPEGYELGDGGESLLSSEANEEVTVVVEPGRRAELYDLLADVEWIVDIRNKIA